MNNDDDLNLHSMTKLSGWLRYRTKIQQGSTCLVLPSRPFIKDLTMYLDVSSNPGPVKTREMIEHRKSLSPATRSINYTRSNLFSLKKCAPSWLPSQLVTVLKDMSILSNKRLQSWIIYSRTTYKK